MKTIETTVRILSNGYLMVENTPLQSDLPAGQYKVVLVINETPEPEEPSNPTLELEPFEWSNWPADATFSRKELYGDDTSAADPEESGELLELKTFKVEGWPPGSTFRREELYGDDGR